MSNISAVIKSIQDIMRKDVGVDGDAQRISQLVWMFFLKIFDDREAERDEGHGQLEPARPQEPRQPRRGAGPRVHQVVRREEHHAVMSARPQVLVDLPRSREQRGKRESPDSPRREEARQARRVRPHRRRGLRTDFGNDLDDGLDGVGTGLG